jgi:hypothetical protein
MSTINTPGIDSILDRYLSAFGLSAISDASLYQANKLFVSVIEDFKSGDLSFDQLASFGFEIFHGIAKRHPQSPLFQASLSASELIFALRSPAVYGNITRYLADIDVFYASHS